MSSPSIPFIQSFLSINPAENNLVLTDGYFKILKSHSNSSKFEEEIRQSMAPANAQPFVSMDTRETTILFVFSTSFKSFAIPWGENERAACVFFEDGEPLGGG